MVIRRLRHALLRLFACSRHGHDLIVRRRADWIGQARCIRCGARFAVLLRRPGAPLCRWTRRMDAPFAKLEAEHEARMVAEMARLRMERIERIDAQRIARAGRWN